MNPLLDEYLARLAEAHRQLQNAVEFCHQSALRGDNSYVDACRIRDAAYEKLINRVGDLLRIHGGQVHVRALMKEFGS